MEAAYSVKDIAKMKRKKGYKQATFIDELETFLAPTKVNGRLTALRIVTSPSHNDYFLV